jgi:site-specific recombinase
MGMFHRTAKNDEAKKQEVETPVITIDSIHRGLDYLVELVKQIRPARYADGQEAELKFKALFYQLLHDKKVLFSLRKALLSQFLNSNFITALTESGLVSSRGFLQELMTKIKHRLLPPLLRPDDFLYVINHVFYKKNDHVWVEKTTYFIRRTTMFGSRKSIRSCGSISSKFLASRLVLQTKIFWPS